MKHGQIRVDTIIMKNKRGDANVGVIIAVVAGVFVIAIILIGVVPYFRDNVIGFFKSLGGGGETGVVTPSCATGTYPKSGIQDNIGFKIGNNPETFNYATKTSSQNVELVVILKSSCEKIIEYNVFIDRAAPPRGTLAIDNFVFKSDCLTDINTALNNLPKEKYYVQAFCYRQNIPVSIKSKVLAVI